jgi:hypothetical protein
MFNAFKITELFKKKMYIGKDGFLTFSKEKAATFHNWAEVDAHLGTVNSAAIYQVEKV